MKRGEKVLACAPSNTAVDNLLERFCRLDLRVVRIGHPARVQEDLQAHTLDVLVENDSNMELVRSMLRQADQLSRQASRTTRAKPPPGMRQSLRQETKELRDDARRLEKQVIDGYLDNADIVCATTTFDPAVLGDRQFDLAIIDEACQSTEPGCWPVISRAGRIVLAGDHCQLPPTVLSTSAAEQGFAISLMERLVKDYDHAVTRPLITQYRMHQDIMQFSSDQFYKGTLVAHDSVSKHLLRDLASMVDDLVTNRPLGFIDTAGSDCEEELEPDGQSRRNPGEGKVVLKVLQQLCERRVEPRDIAVIAPYAAQVRWLREHCKEKDIEIDTVDGFQGREKEVVVITLVRSNSTGELGFLNDTRRMNVALTRAKRKLYVIGDSATLASHPFYASLLEYFENRAAYHSIWEPDFNPMA